MGGWKVVRVDKKEKGKQEEMEIGRREGEK